MNNKEIARILRDVIVELYRSNMVNQTAWDEDLQMLNKFIEDEA